MPAVPLAKASDPLVLALDIGSSASCVRIFDATGAPVRGTRHRLAHEIQAGSDGSALIDAPAILRDVSQLIDMVLATGKFWSRIEGVAMDFFGSTLLGVDAAGQPLTPCLTYADARSAGQVRVLRRELDEATVQQRTGCRFSTSYLPAQLRWWKETRPGINGEVARWLSLGEYVFANLTGTYAISHSTAAWSGLLDRTAGEWDTGLIEAVGAHPPQFSAIHDTTAPVDGTDSPAARRWPALARARWYPPIIDGFASNVGTGATDARTIALAAGTTGALRSLVEGTPATVPAGLWCYRVDAGHSLVGGALNDVGRLAAWLRERLRLPEESALNATLLAPPIPGTPVVLPFLTGERSPGWAATAQAVFAGISATTDATALWRGAMEALALRYRLIAQQLSDVTPDATRVIASGGVVEATPGWLQIVADALGRPVVRSAERYATLWGTALIALADLAPHVPRIATEVSEEFTPVAGRATYYHDAGARQSALYAAVVDGDDPHGANAGPVAGGGAEQ